MGGLVVVVGRAEGRGPCAAAVVAEAQARGARSRLVSQRQAPPERRLPGPVAFLWAAGALGRHLARRRLLVRPGRERDEVVVVDGTWHDVVLWPSSHEDDGWLLRASLPLWPLVPRADVAVVCALPPGGGTGGETWRDRVSSQLAPWMADHVIVAAAGTPPGATARQVLELLAGRESEPTLAWAALPVAHLRDQARVTVGPSSRPLVQALRPARAGAAVARVNAALVEHRMSPARIAPIDGLDELCRSLGVIPDGMASVRLRKPGRRLVSVTERGQLRLFVKFGAVGDVGLRREAGFLAKLDGSANGVIAPRLWWEGEWADRYAVVTAAVPRRPSPRGAALAELALTTSLMLAGATVAAPPGPVVHGDLAPWNLLTTPDGPALVDWEHARGGHLPLHDLSHFVVQRARLLRWSSPDGALADLVARGSLGWRYLQACGIDPRHASELVLAYLRGTAEQTPFHHAMRARLDR